MSDFFANLAARAVEGSASIRPRIATRFEPVARPDPLTEVIVETTAPLTATPTPLVPIVEKAPRAMPSPPASEPTASVAVAPSPQATLFPMAVSVAPKEPPPGRSALPELPQPDENVPATITETIVAAPSAATPRQPSARDATPTPEPSAAPDGDRAPAQPVIERTDHTAGPATSPFPLTLPPSRQREIGTTAAARGAAVERPEQPPVETIVHVSIGRIELRQPSTPPATRRERAPPAVTTLAEYLQQRARK